MASVHGRSSTASRSSQRVVYLREMNSVRSFQPRFPAHAGISDGALAVFRVKRVEGLGPRIVRPVEEAALDGRGGPEVDQHNAGLLVGEAAPPQAVQRD